MTGSQHIMRVVPDRECILPGYLYAFLASPIGYALVTQGTYGGLVQHIEPHHIEHLPVPRLDPAAEQRIHDLIEEAARLRVEAATALREVRQQMLIWLGNEDYFKYPYDHARAVGVVHIPNKITRLDAYFHIGFAGEAAQHPSLYDRPNQPLGKIADRVFNPPIFKRIFVGKEGVPYFTGAEVYEIHPKPSRYISRRTSMIDEYILQEGMIAIQDAGQRYGF